MSIRTNVLCLLVLNAANCELLAQDRTAPQTFSNRPFTTDIRVNLTPTPAQTVHIESRVPIELRRLSDQRLLGTLNSLDSDASVVADRWKVGNQSYAADGLELIPKTSPAIWIDDHQYRGRVLLVRSGTKMVAVNVVDLSDYVASVIDSEMPLSFGEAARQSQAIVARTYALYQRERSGRRQFDVFGSTRSQKYLGYQYRSKGRRLAGESESSRKIARDTAGIVCTHKGELICTYYSAVCGGKTRLGTEVFSDAAAPLKPVECKWCEPSPLYRWNRKLELAEASRLIRELAKSRKLSFQSIASVKRSTNSNPPVDIITFSDGANSLEVPADVVRSNLFPQTLPSSLFVSRVNDSTIEFAGAGHGHRVGLCQWGASGLGKAGATSLQILHFYYPGVTVVRLTN